MKAPWFGSHGAFSFPALDVALKTGQNASSTDTDHMTITPGDKFGMLTVLSKTPGAKNKHSHAECLCDCGNRRSVRQRRLNNGDITCCTSCTLKQAWTTRERAHLTDRIVGRILSHYKANARRRGLPFELNIMQFRELLQGDCHFCGSAALRPAKPKKGPGAMWLNGIDRLQNELGYLPENVVSCCTQCNFAKRESSVQEFLEWVRKVHSHQKLTVK